MQIVFRLSKQRAGDLFEVGVRVYQGTFNHSAQTGIFAHPKWWNANEGRCIINRRFETPDNARARSTQQRLDSLADYLAALWQQSPTHLPDWLSLAVASYNNPHEELQPLSQQIDAYCNARRVMPETRRKMQVLGRLMERYAADTGSALTQQLTRTDLDRFAAYLMQDGTRSENSVHCRLRQLRTLLYWVGKPHPNPFDDYTIPADAYGTPIYLTRDERDFVARYNDLTPMQRVQRDVFIFQCHTGCRVGDLMQLRPQNVRDGWLVYVPRKTSRAKPATVEVPLSPAAVEIVERYQGVDTQGRLLPFVTPQAYGKAIHNILRACACDRPVMVFDPLTQQTTAVPLWQAASSHTARKTFTQIMYAATNDKRLVASMTGHSENSQAFNRYSEITREIKQAALAATL